MSEFIITRDNGSQELLHYGIKGQKWGDRNYQYEDGTLTPAGKERYRELKKKYRPTKIDHIHPDNFKNNKLTDSGYGKVTARAQEASVKSGTVSTVGKVLSALSIIPSASASIGSLIAASVVPGPAKIPFILTSLAGLTPTALAVSFTKIVNDNYENSKKVLEQDKKTTMSEVNEYLALKEVKNKK